MNNEKNSVNSFPVNSPTIYLSLPRQIHACSEKETTTGYEDGGAFGVQPQDDSQGDLFVFRGKETPGLLYVARDAYLWRSRYIRNRSDMVW